MKRINNKNDKRRAKLAKIEKDIERGLAPVADLDGIEAVVGIPFYDEDDTLPGVVETACRGLALAGLSGKSIVVCVGPEGSTTALDGALRKGEGDHGVLVHGFLHTRGLEGRGCCNHSILEAASRFGAPLVLLPPDISPQSKNADEQGQGFSPTWIKHLLTPVHGQKQDLALPRFSRDPLARSVEAFVASPIFTGVFGFRLRQPTPGVMALSARLVRSCLSAADYGTEDLGAYGFEPWIVTHALAEDLVICEVPLGAAAFKHRVGKLKTAFHQSTHALFNQVVLHSKRWLGRTDPIEAPGVYGPYLDVMTPRLSIEPKEIHRRFKYEFNHFDHNVLFAIIPDELRVRMERLADEGPNGEGLTEQDWIKVLHRFLIAFRYEKHFHPDDIVDALFPLFLARIASFIIEIKKTEADLIGNDRIDPITVENIVRQYSEKTVERQADLFVNEWPSFRADWLEHQAETTTYLPMVGAWEFVPNIGVIVPQEIKRADEKIVLASDVYLKQIERYRQEFTRFLRRHLGITKVATSSEILSRVQGLMNNLNWSFETVVYPYDLATVEGTRRMTDDVFAAFADGTAPIGNGTGTDHESGMTFQLKPEIAAKILKQAPPRNLIMQLGCGNVGGLLQQMDPNDALGMASWTDRQLYLEQILDIIEKDGDRTWFHLAPLKSVIVDLNRMTNLTELRGITALTRLAGRVMVGSMQKGWGGEYPKLWFMLSLAKTIVSVEQFSRIWQRFAVEKSDFSKRLVASVRGHWGRHVLSAHNAFENQQQRVVAERLARLSKDLGGDAAKKDAAKLLKAVAESYHLSITLPDATFVPLSAWTWTSYSSRGGFGAPTPLSSLVERDWATRDFLESYLFEAQMGDAKTIDDKIVEMIGEGRESGNLRDELLGISADPDEIVVRQALDAVPKSAGKLVRPVDGPILEPVADHQWESRYVLNAAAVRLDGTIYILYRAFGDDGISRIGLAWTKDGVNIDGRLDKPIYAPDPDYALYKTEEWGTEDPRVTIIGDRMYMLYTAWNKVVAQIAMASIPVEAFIKRDFEKWERHGLGFPGLPNKDAVLYPEKFGDRYVIYHRIDPNMWISYLDDLACPWPRTGQKIVTGPRPGMMWDGVKVGAGAQPIKTRYGWLNIYHGVDYERSYRLGVLFMDLNDPSNVIYQSPNPILEPEIDFETGSTGNGDYWVPHVVFTCGAVPAVDKEILDLDDEVFVYYGAADTAIGVAKARLRDLVPILNDK